MSTSTLRESRNMGLPRRWAWTWTLLTVVPLIASPAAAQQEVAQPAASAASAAKEFGSSAVTVVKPGAIVPPRLVPACKPGACPFAGQTVTLLLPKSVIAVPILEVKEEFEAATGATLKIVQVASMDLFDHFYSDVANRVGKYDALLASAWWLGELVTGDHLVAYDKWYRDPRFPKWDVNDVLPGPRSLLSYGGKKYMIANDHDGQVMYYRSDLLADPQHQKAFAQKYGYALDVPRTWAQFRDVAEYFDGRELIGDGMPAHGLTLSLIHI